MSKYRNWQSEIANSAQEPGQLRKMLRLSNENDDPILSEQAFSGHAYCDAIREAIQQFPVRVPASWASRISKGDPNDPLLLQVMPSACEARPSDDSCSVDPLGEAGLTDPLGVIQKYTGRLLVLATDECAMNCRFCFRRHRLTSGPTLAPIKQRIDAICDRVARDSSINEVILSGGDPLMLDDGDLLATVGLLSKIPHVRRLRIHTRMPIAVPSRFDRPRLLPHLAQVVRHSSATFVMVLHCNHPSELDDEVRDALDNIASSGIMLLSQSVLLRGVNDSVETLQRLMERLIEFRVMPYYLHQLDRVAGAMHFEVDPEKGRDLIQQLRDRLPGYAIPRYVQEVPGESHKVVLG